MTTVVEHPNEVFVELDGRGWACTVGLRWLLGQFEHTIQAESDYLKKGAVCTGRKQWNCSADAELLGAGHTPLAPFGVR